MTMSRSFGLMVALGAVLGFATSASAAPVFCGAPTICYDDVSTTFVDFTGINETVSTADDIPVLPTDGLYNIPTGLGVNTLFFNPPSFDADSFGAGDFDQSHSLLNATITANDHANNPITSITIREFGDFTFAGFGGTAATGAQQFIGGTLTILDADNPLLVGETFGLGDEILNANPLLAGHSESFNVSSAGTITEVGGGFTADFPSNGPGANNYEIEWILDIAGLGIKSLELQLNNTQFTNAEAGTTADIQKKVQLTVVPEPGTGSLLALGLTALAASRRRARR